MESPHIPTFKKSFIDIRPFTLLEAGPTAPNTRQIRWFLRVDDGLCRCSSNKASETPWKSTSLPQYDSSYVGPHVVIQDHSSTRWLTIPPTILFQDVQKSSKSEFVAIHPCRISGSFSKNLASRATSWMVGNHKDSPHLEMNENHEELVDLVVGLVMSCVTL